MIVRPSSVMSVCFVTLVVALFSGESGLSSAQTPLHNGLFFENRGQLTTSLGTQADSIIAYARLGDGWIHVTHTTIYVSRAETTRSYRYGITIPADYSARLTESEEETTSLQRYVGSSNQPLKSASSLTFMKSDESASFRLRILGDTLSLDYLSRSQNAQPLPRLHLQGLKRSTTGHGDPIRWTDAEGRAVFTEIVPDEGRPTFAARDKEPVFSSETLGFDDLHPSGGPTILSPDPVRHLTVLLKASTFLGGSGTDSLISSTPIDGGLIICGFTTSSAFPCTPGVSQTALKGSRDAWIARYDENAKPIWSTYFGGNGDDIASGCVVSGAAVFVSGSTTSTDIGTSGTMKSAFQGGTSDAFVAVVSLSAGTKTACTYVGGPEADEGKAVCALPNGDIALCGTTSSPDFGFKGHQAQLTGGADAFAVVLDPALSTLRWGTYYGGRADEEGRGIASLDDGSIIMIGNTSSPNSGLRIAENVGQGSTPPGGLQTSGFVTRLTPTGTRAWGRYLGGDAFDTLMCVRTFKNEIYVGGFSNSQSGGGNNFISGGSAQPGSGSGINDGFISKLNPDGTLIWGTFIGGSNDDKVLGLTVTPTGDVIACGTTNSENFPVVESDQKSLAGGYDAFVAYLLKTGQKYGRVILLGGSNNDESTGSSFLANRSVLVTGTTSSSNFPTAQAVQPAFAGACDAFISLLEPLYTVSVPDVFASTTQLLAYPIPTGDRLTMTNPTVIHGPSVIRCLSSTGKEVFTTAVLTDTDSYTLDVSSLPPGMYSIIWSDLFKSAACTIIHLRP